LLPVYDNMKRAIEAVGDEQRVKLQIGRKYVYLGKIVTLKDLEDGRAMVFSWHGGHRWVDIDKLEDNLP